MSEMRGEHGPELTDLPAGHTAVWDDIVGIYERMAPTPPPEPFRFTQWQWGLIKAVCVGPAPRPFPVPDIANTLHGIPVHVVDDVAESTPVTQGWPGDWTEPAPPSWVRQGFPETGDTPPHAVNWMRWLSPGSAGRRSP